MMKNPWCHEKMAKKDGFHLVAGVDEAGRGPLAGPVVSSAVILPETFRPQGLTDSKKLPPSKRSSLYDTIYRHAIAVGIGIVDPVQIDRINILRAALLSMVIAVDNLYPRPDFLLIDGKFEIDAPFAQKAIVKGDSLSISIAAASVVAKVSRDKLMERYHEDYPQFGFSKHKGYPTKAHREAIKIHGCTPIHRRTFKGVKEYV